MTDDELIIRLTTLAESMEGEGAQVCEDAAERIGDLLNEVESAEEDAREAHSELNALEADQEYAQALWEAIVERRTEDAVVLLRKVFDIDFMDVRTYGNLFPERIK